MGFYGNFKMQKELCEISVNESYLVEKVSVTAPTTKYGNYKTDKKFKGVTVEIDKPLSTGYSDQQITEITDKMEKDLKVLSKNFDKIIKKEFEGLFNDCENWGMEYCKTVEDLMKLATLTNVIYEYHPDKNISLFEIWYNGKAPYNPKFFGGHSFAVELHINNKSLVARYGQLEG